MFGGGYLAGRYARNSKIQEYPMPLIAGGLGLLGARRARSMAGKGAGVALSVLIGAGCYGAGKLGEQHGEKAGNDGNIFSWSKEGGVKTD